MIAGDVSNDPPWKEKMTQVQRHLALGPLPASRAKFAPRAVRKPYAKEQYKSGFFYIEGCFYNDNAPTVLLLASQFLASFSVFLFALFSNVTYFYFAYSYKSPTKVLLIGEPSSSNLTLSFFINSGFTSM